MFECRRGGATLRQGADRAGARTGRCLGSRYAVVPLRAQALSPEGTFPLPTTAWEHPSPATLAAVLAAGRRPVWGACSDATSTHAPDGRAIPRAALQLGADAVCDAHAHGQSRA